MDDKNATRKTQLSAAKRALLAKRLQGKSDGPSRPTIPQRDPAALVPLSFSQQRIWFLYQFEPENPFYNVPFALHLKGELDIQALEQGFQTLVQRHEILRTTIADTTGQPQQIIHPQGTISLQQIDVTASTETLWSEVERLAHQEAARPFDLRQGPLLRVTLLTLAADEFVLLVTLHHIISDVWSTTVLVQEIVALYYAFTQSKPSPLAPLPIQYGDFTLWQRQMLQGERLQTQIKYWQQQFATLPPVLQLPTDRPRPAVQSFRGRYQTFTLSSQLTAALKALAQKTNATLFMTLLAGFKLLLHRYSGQTDITVGSPIANRNHAAIEGLIGLFMNTLALRTDLGGNPSFRELLGRVQEVALGAYSHQDLPFEKLIEVLQLPRNLSHGPLFQVMFILQNAPARSINLSGLTFDLLELSGNTAKFDLTLILMEADGGLEGTVEYNTDLFDHTTIERLLGHFQTLLEGIVAAPDTPIHSLPWLTPDEWTQLHQWNQTQGQYSTDSCLHQLFEAQVANNPEAVAVTDESHPLTYGELNHRADCLAQCLRGMGVGPEFLVGLCLERSQAMIIALLAVLKAGGAYVPLDPSYPQQRLAFMVEDAKLDILLTQSHLSQILPDYAGQRLYLDQPLPDSVTGAVLPPSVQPENLAYMIYTSGSTGKPKGVQISHRAVVNFLQTQGEALGISHNDCLLAVTSLSFDIAVLELFLPLTVGGQVVVASREATLDGFRLAEQLAAGVTFMQATPSTWRMLLLADWAGNPELTVLCGGEALPPDLAVALRSRCATLWNMYGPTETTIWSAQQQIKKTDPVTIGTPIGNTQIYLLDQHLNPMPVGVPGELYIGGQGLARGYYQRPELTAERFIPHPFSQTPGERLYRTGDLARYRADGTLEVLGRLDHQAKIRGFRIELGEIESVLSRHQQVRDVVAMVREDSPGQKRLVAYLTSQKTADQGSPNATIGDLRQWLQTQLPDYMIPAGFVWLEQMPLTPNGKIDRRALPVPDTESNPVERPFTAPRSPLEQNLAAIWSQVLGGSTIGIDDNFFELGGDSILSLQVVAQAHQAGLQLTPKQLFQHQTIRTLATVAKPMTSRVAEQGPVVGTVPLSPSQQWFFSQPWVTPHHWHQSVLLNLHQPLTREDLQAILQPLLTHHDGLHATFQHQGSTWVQTISAPPESEETLPCQLVEVPPQSEADQTQTIANTAAALQTHLDLTGGPLIKVVLFNLAGPESQQRLLLMVHHLVIDTVSWQILLTDFQTLAHQRLQGKPFQLPPKTTSLQQWGQRLPTIPLENSQSLPSRPPMDFPGRENTVATSRTLAVSLGLTETQSLLQQVPSVYHTHINDILLTALTLAYGDWTGQSQLLIDLEDPGRESLFEDIDVSRTVGWFAHLCPVLLDLTGIDHLGVTIKTVKEQLRQVTRRGLAYGVHPSVRSESGVDAKTPEESWPSIRFCYLGQIEPRFEADDLFTLAAESPGPNQGWQNLHPHQLSIEADIVAGQLQVRWTYSSGRHRPTTIESLATTFLQKVRSLITHCLSPGAGGYTPSDLPLAQLEQGNLDRLVEQYPQLVDGYPLSPSQQGILFHALYAPEDGLYINQICCRLQGALDVDVLKQTWQQVSDRHSILRTVFVWENLSKPLQVVLRQAPLSWHPEDWRSHTPETQATKLTKLLQRDRALGFQLSGAPPMRLTLIQLADDRHEVIWSFHHLLMDGWSLPLLFREVFLIYEGLCQGRPPQLDNPRPYGDYVAWLSTQDSSEAAKFWTPLLQGFRTPTPLKYNKPSHLAPDHRIQTRSLSAAATAALQTLAQRAHLTLNTLVQGVWALLLSHISGEQDIVFGATTAGRPHDLAGADTMLGLFINSLPVRVHLSPDINAIAWLQELQTQQSQARQYEYVALSQIQRWSEMPAGKPLFESLVVFENYPIDTALDAIQFSLKLQSIQSFINNNYPITLRALPGEELVLQIMADRTCFTAELTERWLRSLESLLQWLVEHPTAALGDWQEQLTLLDRQWQQQQAQSLTQTSLKKLRKTRRKAVRSNHQEGIS